MEKVDQPDLGAKKEMMISGDLQRTFAIREGIFGSTMHT
jgi:hypothetical protein